MIITPSLIKVDKKINHNITFDHLDVKHQEIYEIHEVFASGIIKWENDNLFVDLKIDADLTLASTKTLEPIKHKFTFPLNLIFGDHKEADFVLENEIDLSEIIFGHIILEKPISIYHKDEEVYVDKSKKVNPFFEDLKDYKL